MNIKPISNGDQIIDKMLLHVAEDHYSPQVQKDATEVPERVLSGALIASRHVVLFLSRSGTFSMLAKDLTPENFSIMKRTIVQSVARQIVDKGESLTDVIEGIDQVIHKLDPYYSDAETDSLLNLFLSSICHEIKDLRFQLEKMTRIMDKAALDICYTRKSLRTSLMPLKNLVGKIKVIYPMLEDAVLSRIKEVVETNGGLKGRHLQKLLSIVKQELS